MSDTTSDKCRFIINILINILGKQTKIIEDLAIKALNADQDYKSTVRVRCPNFELSDYRNIYNEHQILYAKIYGKVHYITLIHSDSDADLVEADFHWYESKIDMDRCQAIVKLKQTIRAMQKKPERFFRIGY